MYGCWASSNGKEEDGGGFANLGLSVGVEQKRKKYGRRSVMAARVSERRNKEKKIRRRRGRGGRVREEVKEKIFFSFLFI